MAKPCNEADLRLVGHTPEQVRAVVRGLTKPQRTLVKDGCIHGDFTMTTVRALQRKGLFSLVIDSPNGRCGFMRLTPLGQAVRAAMSEPPKSAQLKQDVRELAAYLTQKEAANG
jgi:DNA-binding MarR family transcriptional regulator